MNFSTRLCLIVTMFLSLFAGCASSDATPLLASDDCGPKPQNYRQIVADWFNSNYKFTPPTPLRPDEFSVSEPTKAATTDFLLGRKVGWQVILGPENTMLTNFTHLNYTRLIVNRDWIVSIESRDSPF